MNFARKSSMVHDIQLPMGSKFSNNLKFLDNVLDDKLSLSRQVSLVCACSYYNLRKIYSIRESIRKDSFIVLVRVLICNRLDYCNLLFYGSLSKITTNNELCMHSNFKTITWHIEFELH